jgi:hypothetical protein
MIGRCFRRSAKFCVPQLHMLAPEPGTELYSQFGDQLRFDGYITDYNAWLLDDGDQQSILSHPDIFVTYYFYPTVMPREYYTSAVDACRELRKLGHTVLTYVQRYYDNRLSQLVARIREWATENASSRVLNDELLLDFFAGEFGPNHHVTSLARYALCTRRAREPETTLSVEPLPKANAFDLDQRYQLGPRTFLLKDIHNCNVLLDQIRNAADNHAPLDDRDTGERECYLVIGSGGKDGVFRNYAIDTAAYTILSLFEKPRSLHHVSLALAELTDGIQVDRHFFEGLIRIGALVPAMSEREAHSGIATASVALSADYVDE